ncbi:E3 SUMO-protein ligase ZBED1-like [Drosophila rhopaloa]|uniref:Zinc finger BED domain-containing protein 1-like n=1 Tax=Drosophila rhopaloa TaxID=1041015 RepID=A0A6P4E6R5_DRORH|nr:E3 SUMO-protein ligase ZBED1-like [Drosophila rhopaloa]
MDGEGKNGDKDVEQTASIDIEVVGKAQEKSLKKLSRLASSVWDLFEKTKDGREAKCRICKTIYKTSGNTSNLADHLKRFHPTHSQYKATQPTVKKFFNHDEYDSNSVRKASLDMALMGMIAKDIQPFSIVEDEGFRKFVKLLDPRYTLPSRTTLQDVKMKNMYIPSVKNYSRSVCDYNGLLD